MTLTTTNASFNSPSPVGRERAGVRVLFFHKFSRAPTRRGHDCQGALPRVIWRRESGIENNALDHWSGAFAAFDVPGACLCIGRVEYAPSARTPFASVLGDPGFQSHQPEQRLHFAGGFAGARLDLRHHFHPLSGPVPEDEPANAGTSNEPFAAKPGPAGIADDRS